MATTAQIIIRLGKLQSTLLTSGLQQSNQPLYQVISQLIRAIIDSAEDTIAITGVVSGSIPSLDKTFLTVGNEQASMPQSSQLIAGTNISFDTSIFGQLRIDGASSGGSEWSVLTNGDSINPELIFAGGDVIMLHTP